MIVSYEKRFLFVHIAKTGGSSVRAALQPYQHDPQHYLVNRLLKRCGINTNLVLGGYRQRRFRPHTMTRTAQACLPTEVFAGLFKFAFVRNPWDQLASYYKYYLKMPNHKRHTRVKRMKFDEFIDFAVAKRLGFQKQMLSDADGNLLVDFVGRFEHIKRDFLHVANQLGIVARLPHLNWTWTAPYQEFYSSGSIDRVARAYRDVIVAFGYEYSAA